MARADLIESLVQNGMKNDKVAFRKTVEAIIAEERAKQHNVLAQKLEQIINAQPLERPVTNNVPAFDQRSASLFHEVIPQKSFKDLILNDTVRQVCYELIEEQHRSDLLRSYNMEPRNRLLLIGPPGNGKTSLAEAVAEALMVPLFVVRYESIIGTYLGETAVRLRKLFEYVATRKCVLFFDEFETLGKERGDIHETGEIKRVVSSLLLQIDSLPSYVVVIGATNHEELLDRAVWRRFQIRVNINPPTRTGIVEYFKRFEEKINIPLGYSPETLAKRLYGLSYAEIEEFTTTAYRHYILKQPNINMKTIISEILQQWKLITAKADNKNEVEVSE